MIENKDAQYIYNQLFFYFKAFQNLFPDDWPVPLYFNNKDDLEMHAEYVLKSRKSQLVKTNGFGAIMRLFPLVYKEGNREYDDYYSFYNHSKGE